VLASGEPDFPFCLAWANEAWTRTWLGSGQEIMPQTYSPADDAAHARWLVDAFADRRHLTVDGRAVFVVYRPGDLPEPKRTTDTIRETATRAGLAEPFLLGMNSWNPSGDARTLGFDGTIDFAPQLSDLVGYRREGANLWRLRRNLALGVRSSKLKLYSDSEFRTAMAARRAGLDFPTYRTVLVGWDNTARRGERAIIVTGSTPDALAADLQSAVDDVATRPVDERLVFVNAWNEWAEGNYLEPDKHYGRARLEAVRTAVSGAAVSGVRRPAPR
jgi:hypothetical protein